MLSCETLRHRIIVRCSTPAHSKPRCTRFANPLAVGSVFQFCVTKKSKRLHAVLESLRLKLDKFFTVANASIVSLCYFLSDETRSILHSLYRIRFHLANRPFSWLIAAPTQGNKKWDFPTVFQKRSKFGPARGMNAPDLREVKADPIQKVHVWPFGQTRTTDPSIKIPK